MRLQSPVLRGDFSIEDLLREAARRSIEVVCPAQETSRIHTPVMSGLIVADEVQPGLVMSASDLTYTTDCRIDVQVGTVITCGILLEGEGNALEVEGRAPIVPESGRVVIVGYGQPSNCARPWRRGQRARVFGLTLRPSFFERFGHQLDNDGLSLLRRFMEPGIHSTILPWSRTILDVANAIFEEPYGGTLRSLFRESQALRFTLEVAGLLRNEARIAGSIGRRQYDRARRARDLLDQALVDPPTMLDLGQSLGVNVTTLQANFKAAFGTTIFAYVRSRRLDIARVLIREHGIAISEAGYRVGFTNAAAFTAAYRRHFGRPPSADR